MRRKQLPNYHGFDGIFRSTQMVALKFLKASGIKCAFVVVVASEAEVAASREHSAQHEILRNMNLCLYSKLAQGCQLEFDLVFDLVQAWWGSLAIVSCGKHSHSHPVTS